jgi:hypothetical protein
MPLVQERQHREDELPVMGRAGVNAARPARSLHHDPRRRGRGHHHRDAVARLLGQQHDQRYPANGRVFAKFDRADLYEQDQDGERVLKRSHVAKRISMMAASFRRALPARPMAVFRCLRARRRPRRSHERGAGIRVPRDRRDAKIPARGDGSALDKHAVEWRHRRMALRTVDYARGELVKVLQKHEAEREAQERRRRIEGATCAVANAARRTQQLA